MKNLSLILILLGLSFNSIAIDLKTFTDNADAFFVKYVENGSVEYAKVKQNISEIEKLYKSVGSFDVKGLTENETKSFYINAYNLVVIYWVSKYYPLKSPLDASGFFDMVKHNVAGEELTLNRLEIKKLLGPYTDARVHFALACAAKSCPPLANFAYRPEKLEQQLTDRTMLSLNNKSWLVVNAKEKKVELSKIFNWYKAEFNLNGKTTLDWINQYRKEKIPSTFAIEYYEYNWVLNDKK